MSRSTHIRLLRGEWVWLLVFLGIVHLGATPHISRLIQHLALPGAAAQLTPPMLLNQYYVGLLLLPLGYLTFYGGTAFGSFLSKLAQIIVRTTAVTVAALPLLLLALMGTRYFGAPLFVLGTMLVIAAAVTLLVAAVQ